MVYIKQRPDWVDGEAGNTLIRAQDLDGMEQGIADAHTIAESKQADLRLVAGVGIVADDATDNTTTLNNLIASNPGRAILLPPGTIRCTQATRILLEENGSSLVGEPSGLSTVLKFTNAAGGIDIGNGTDLTYENRLINIAISGNAIATTLVRCRKMYEPYFNGVRIEGFSPTGIGLHLDECGQLDADRVTVASGGTGVKVTGGVGIIVNWRLPNWYALTKGLEVAGATIGRWIMDNGWVEAVTDLVSFNNPGGPISIGEMAFNKIHMLNTSTTARLVRAVAFTGLNGRVTFNDCYSNFSSATTPAIDFTALTNNTGTIRFKWYESYYHSAVAGKLFQVNAGQNWWLFLVDVENLRNVSGYMDPSDVFDATKVWHKPHFIHSVGTPEGTIDAPRGYLYAATDIGKAYVKQTGEANTGWLELSTVGHTHATATTTATGFVELATTLETTTGTDATRAVTPAGVKAVADTKAASSHTHTAADVGATPVRSTPNAQTGTSYTPVLSDENKLVTLNNAAAITVTIPTNATTAFPIGARIDFARLGVGSVTFIPAGGVTLRATPSAVARAQYSGMSLTKLAMDEWLLVGDLA